nr:hypothetical protein [Tanacetum cinerariifolium]
MMGCDEDDERIAFVLLDGVHICYPRPCTYGLMILTRKRNAMINEGVNAALAARDATRNGDDSHTSGTGARRPVQVARECSYSEFLKCKPWDYKGTEGVIELTGWFEKIESI